MEIKTSELTGKALDDVVMKHIGIAREGLALLINSGALERNALDMSVAKRTLEHLDYVINFKREEEDNEASARNEENYLKTC